LSRSRGAGVTLVVTLAALPIVTLAAVRPERCTAFERDKVEEVEDPPGFKQSW